MTLVAFVCGIGKISRQIIWLFWTIPLFGLVSACSDVKTWTLNYQVPAGETGPDLVLVFRVDESGEGEGILQANFVTESQDIDFQPDVLKGLLADCADQLEASTGVEDCPELGEHLGSILFKGSPKLFDPENPSSASNKSGDIRVTSKTSIFYAVFLYGVQSGTPAERCFNLKRATRQGSAGFSVAGASSGQSLSVSVSRGDISPLVNAQRDCFEVPYDN